MQACFICTEIIPLPDEVKRPLNIVTIPNPINIDGTEYLDNRLPFSTEEFSELLMSGKHTIETAVTPPSAYTEAYRATPKDMPIFVICFSPKISAFNKSALNAADEVPDRDITVITSTFCPPALTLWTLSAARLAAESDNAGTFKAALPAMAERIKVYDALFSLKYLHQTGRINAAKAFIGRMIQLVPIITTDNEGIIVPAGKTRRIEKSLVRICELVARDLEGREVSGLDILVTYTGSEENGLRLKALAEERLPVKTCELYKGGYSIHRYLGPDAAGLAYYAHP